MRYDTPVFFQRIIPGEYNTVTCNYDDDTIVETKRYASVTDSGVETLKLVYDGPKQGSLTIRLQRPYTEAFSNIRVGDKVYRADFSRRQKSFVISEVQ